MAFLDTRSAGKPLLTLGLLMGCGTATVDKPQTTPTPSSSTTEDTTLLQCPDDAWGWGRQDPMVLTLGGDLDDMGVCEVDESAGDRCSSLLATSPVSCPPFEDFLRQSGWTDGDATLVVDARFYGVARARAYHCTDAETGVEVDELWVEEEISDDIWEHLGYDDLPDWNMTSIQFTSDGQLHGIQRITLGNFGWERWCCNGTPTRTIRWGTYDSAPCGTVGNVVQEWQPEDFNR